MKLSERIRENCEAAPWVIESVIALEQELALADSLLRTAQKERNLERAMNEALVNDLHRISLASQNSMSGKNECGKIANSAIAKAEGRG